MSARKRASGVGGFCSWRLGAISLFVLAAVLLPGGCTRRSEPESSSAVTYRRAPIEVTLGAWEQELPAGEVERDTQPYYEARLRDGTVFSTASLRPRYDDKTHQLMRWWSEKASVPIREATRGVDW